MERQRPQSEVDALQSNWRKEKLEINWKCADRSRAARTRGRTLNEYSIEAISVNGISLVTPQQQQQQQRRLFHEITIFR